MTANAGDLLKKFNNTLISIKNCHVNYVKPSAISIPSIMHSAGRGGCAPGSDPSFLINNRVN